MLSGRRQVIARMRSNPLFRALRVDKLTYAVLQQTLLAYAREEYDTVPAVAMMRMSAESIRERAEALVERVSGHSSAIAFEIRAGESVLGGGAAPGATLPTFVIAMEHETLNADELSARLRRYAPPIVARVEDERGVLDRTKV